MGEAFAAVLVDDVEGAVGFEFGDDAGVAFVQVAVVSSAQKDEVVEAGLAVVADPLHVVAFGPGGWAIAAREPAVPIPDDQR